MRTFPLRFLLLLFLVSAPAGSAHPGGRSTIGYLTVGGRLSAEDSAVAGWINGERFFALRILDATRSPLENPGVDIVWIHVPDSAGWGSWAPVTGHLRPLAQFYRKGGRLLLTGYGALVPHEIGIESEQPEIRPLAITDDWLFDQKGFQGFRGHPVFDGLFGGVFTWDANVDNVAYRVGFFGVHFPREGKVIGVEKSYVTVESGNRLLIEYSSGKGRAIAVGAYVRFSPPNAMASHLRRFIKNALTFLGAHGSPPQGTYWRMSECRPRRFTVATAPLAPARSDLRLRPESGLRIAREAPRNDFFDVAGRRALVMGRENGGIDELWVHPFRVVRDFMTGLVSGDSIRWLRDVPVSIDVRPESFTRTYTTGAGLLKEVVFPSRRRAGALVHYEWGEKARGVPLIVSYRSDLRWMWPYDERALGDLYWGYDGGLHALHVKDLSGDFSCLIGGSVPPRTSLSGQYDRIRLVSGTLRGDTSRANQVFHSSVYDLGTVPGREMNIAIVGTDEGESRALADYRALLDDPAGEYAANAAHYRSLLARSVTVDSPDPDFNAGWRWAIVGTDRFIAETPRLGTALLAGFSTVDRGWDGGHAVSGRPGYAWYFGRDAEWSGFAIDDYGDFPTVRRELEFIQKYQDMSGKVFHEISTSGVVHYDAADATPLYIVLAAHYIRASGDREFLRASWRHLKNAMDYLYSTDTDGDLLIENTGVGHGWVEGGKLWPVHTEFYLAGIWGEALQDASWMASLLGKSDLARKYGEDALAVKKKVDTEFWNPSTMFYSFGKLKDGSYNPEPTVLPAPVMYFGWLDDRKVLPVLRRYAGDSFSSDWGTRIVSEESPLFNPAGYHYGTVWPLFTGWTSLAEYEYGNSTQAFSHMAENMEIERHWAAGFVQEVLNGSVYAPSGVCPHQCWSETNILHPGIHGMIGWAPLATGHCARLAPRLPIHWKGVTVRNLRAGTSVIRMSFERDDHAMVYRLALDHGRPVTIDLAPEVPAGTVITGVRVNGKSVAVPGEIRRGVIEPPFRVLVRDSAEIWIGCSGGIGVVPFTPRPLPGDSSQGLRLIGAELKGNEYGVDLEGKSGTTGVLRLVLLDQSVLSVTGGTLLGEEPGGEVSIGVPFPPAPGRWAAAHVVVHIRTKNR